MIEVPIQNCGLDLNIGSKYNTEYIDDLINDLSKEINLNNYEYSTITNFWLFKIKYQKIENVQ